MQNILEFDFFGWKIPVESSEEQLVQLAEDIAPEKKMDTLEVVSLLKIRQHNARLALGQTTSSGGRCSPAPKVHYLDAAEICCLANCGTLDCRSNGCIIFNSEERPSHHTHSAAILV